MLSQLGTERLLEAAKGAFGGAFFRFECAGHRVGRLWPVDPGYPRYGDTDKANPDRGDYVLTFKVTIPRGCKDWPLDDPAVLLELTTEKGDVLYGPVAIGPLYQNPNHPVIQYLNLVMR